MTKSTTHLLLALLCTFLIACGQTKKLKSDDTPEIWRYIDNPGVKDTECRDELNRAKRDLQDGKLVVCSPYGPFSSPLRYEQELTTLCRRYGLVFKYEVFSDVFTADNTQGCYGAFMDRKIAAQFGPSFKEHLLARADSLFIVRAQTATVLYTECDTLPHLPGEDHDPEFYVKVSRKLLAQPRPKKDDYGPYMRVSLLIEKDGQAHDFTLVTFIDTGAENDTPKKYRNKLWQVAQVELKKVPLWVPGIVAGHKVKTRTIVSVRFHSN